MSRQIQIRRGTAAEHENFTGAAGEVTMDTTNNTLRVHDGQTAGGIALAKQSEIPDLSNLDYVVEFQAPTAENNYTWYRKYKSGWVEQGGTNEEQNVVLPIEMADNNYQIHMTSTCMTSNNNTYFFGWRNVTTTGFVSQGNVVNSSGGSAVANTAKKHWYVCGLCAL